MPRKDLYHDVVRRALEKDGWIITDDPLYMRIGGQEIYVDLGAEKLIIAEKGMEKIAVEVKSFTHMSFITAFYEAIGKFMLYEEALQIEEPDRLLFLAVPLNVYESEIAEEILIKATIQNRNIHLFVFNIEEEKIELWIK